MGTPGERLDSLGVQDPMATYRSAVAVAAQS